MFVFPLTGLHGPTSLGNDIKTATIAPQDVLTHKRYYECNFLLKRLELPPYRWVRLGGIQIIGGGGGGG